MPIYEYQCEKCGQVDEVFQKISEKPISRCRHCSGKVHKLVSQSSFHLKGSGWYVTDYANKANKSNSSTPKTEKNAGESNSKADASGGDKAAAKAD